MEPGNEGPGPLEEETSTWIPSWFHVSCIMSVSLFFETDLLC